MEQIILKIGAELICKKNPFLMKKWKFQKKNYL